MYLVATYYHQPKQKISKIKMHTEIVVCTLLSIVVSLRWIDNLVEFRSVVYSTFSVSASVIDSWRRSDGVCFVCGFVPRFVTWDRLNSIKYPRTTTNHGDGTRKSHPPNLDRTKKSILASYSAVGNAVPWIYITILGIVTTPNN